MKILLIDDLRNFRHVVDGHEVTVARTSQEALSILAQDNVWDEVWFDHDLGEVDGRIDTIMPVVDYFAEQAFNDTPVDAGIVYVHSSNPVGVKQMMASLQNYGYAVARQAPESVFIVETPAEQARQIADAATKPTRVSVEDHCDDCGF